MHRRTRKVNPKPRWRRLGPRWKPSLPTGGSTGARKSWDRRTPIFALARSGRVGTTPARAEAGASSRNVARRAVPAELKHRRSSFLPPDVFPPHPFTVTQVGSSSHSTSTLRREERGQCNALPARLRHPSKLRARDESRCRSGTCR
jgi:hypothetical protein